MNKTLHLLLYLGVSIGLILSLFYSAFATYVSYHNYPGGNSLRDFNRQFLKDQEFSTNSRFKQVKPYIHIDVYPAMTGIT